MATDLEDASLLAKLSGADIVAIEGKYHFDCLNKYRNKHREQNRLAELDDQHWEARSFAELISYLENCIENESYIFKLRELYALYTKRLHDFGVHTYTHRTRLKEKIILHFKGNVQEQSDGKNAVLIFDEGMKNIIKESLGFRNYDNEALMMTKLVKLIRNEVFNHQPSLFDGSFSKSCQIDSVPPLLKSLVSMLS